MTLTTELTNDLVSRFEALAGKRSGEPAWLVNRRRQAIDRFAASGIPTTRHEDWRWTNLAALARTPLRPAALDAPRGVDPRSFAPLTTGLEAIQVVLVNGRYDAAASRSQRLPKGVRIVSLARMLEDDPETLERHLGVYASDERALTALNAAFWADGVFIDVPDGVQLDTPVHVVSIADPGRDPLAVTPRALVLLGKESRLTLVETHAALRQEEPTASYLGAPVVEVFGDAGSSVFHARLVREASKAFHVGTAAVHLAAASRYLGHVYALSGGLVRSESHVRLGGERADATLYGLYYSRDEQLVDNHTRFEHAAPACTSWQVFKGILDGASRGVFDGRILVRQVAQKTDAKQTSRNLLLSDAAVSNNKPQLEIYADDVKCTHGATTGRLDPAQIFYLRARGLSEEAARSLLIFAFARETVDGIENAALRAIVERELLDKLPMGHLILGSS